MKKNKNIKKHVEIWYTIGRIAPLGALFLLCVALIFDVQGWLEWLLYIIGALFAMIAFTWWWWVLDTVRALFTMLEQANERFKDIIEDLKGLKQDLNDSPRKRNKSKKD
tara:strand:- start:2940 stop:3266 length:327 start_codon:yes stop_codon:yes gene_type:complete